jgi:hypothetical protein
MGQPPNDFPGDPDQIASVHYAPVGDHPTPSPRRWANWFAAVAAIIPPLAYGYVRLGENDPRMHLWGWTFIVHHDQSMAVWTPWNNLLAMDLSGFIAAVVVGSFVYLIAWSIRGAFRFTVRLRRGLRPDPRRGFPLD